MFTAPRNGHGWPAACAFDCDCDGLLIDSNGPWATAYRAVADTAGARAVDLDLSRLGASVVTAARELSEQLGQPIAVQLLHQHLHAALEREPADAMPGAHAFLKALDGRMPLAVASNGQPASCAMRCATPACSSISPPSSPPTFVTGLVRAGNDLVLVAELAGHRRLETTRRYSLPSEADRMKAVTDLEIDF